MTDRTFTLDIGPAFSRYCAGRYISDGPHSGEALRALLFDALSNKDFDRVLVNLDSALGLSASFLEEAFGGLIRECGLRKDDLDKRLILKSTSNQLKSEIVGFIKDAHLAKTNGV